MVYASSEQMKCFECGDVGHKCLACPHKQHEVICAVHPQTVVGKSVAPVREISTLGVAVRCRDATQEGEEKKK